MTIIKMLGLWVSDLFARPGVTEVKSSCKIQYYTLYSNVLFDMIKKIIIIITQIATFA